MDGAPRPSTLVAEHFAERTVELQGRNAQLYVQLIARAQQEQPGANNQVVVGAFVRSYRFSYVDDQDFGQGHMWIEFGSRRIKVPVTVVIIGGTEDDGKTAARIVKETSKISDFSDWVLDAHFTTYSERIGKFIVVYERFLQRYNFEGAFFEGLGLLDDDKYRLTSTWTSKMRKLIELLDHARSSSVTHGSLNHRGSYVNCDVGGIKLINVARTTGGYSPEKDLADLASFLEVDDFFEHKWSGELSTFVKLLSSRLVKEFFVGWKDVLLGHPLLQKNAAETIAAFRGVHRSKGELTLMEATKLANLLHHQWCWPEYKKIELRPKKNEKPVQRNKRLAKLRTWRQKALRNEFDAQSAVITGLFRYTTPEEPTPYGGYYMHLEVINLGRNLIHHGHHYMEELWDKGTLLKEMFTHFSSYFSMAYYLVHTLDEHAAHDGPYECEETATPPPAYLPQAPLLGHPIQVPPQVPVLNDPVEFPSLH